MRRSERFLALAVVAFAVFVGVQIARRPTHAGRVVRAEPSSDTRTTVVASRSSAERPALTTNLAETSNDRASLVAATPGTYMPDMLADLHGMLVRWPDRREQGLRVWVQSLTAVHDWDFRYAQMARDAFADWNAGLPVRFDFVLDSATSDVQVVWIDKFGADVGQRIGTTSRTNDHNGWLVKAQIIVAVHDSAGRTIPPADLAGIVRHEAGHALGLGHSKNPRTKMFPVETSPEISAMDRATLKLLYQMAPGPVR